VILSDRLRLRDWRDSDGDALAALNADPEVSRDLGGPLSGAESDALKHARLSGNLNATSSHLW